MSVRLAALEAQNKILWDLLAALHYPLGDEYRRCNVCLRSEHISARIKHESECPVGHAAEALAAEQERFWKEGQDDR